MMPLLTLEVEGCAGIDMGKKLLMRIAGKIFLNILTSLTSEYQSFDLPCVEVFPLKFLPNQQPFGVTALAPGPHGPNSTFSPVPCCFPGRLVGDPECSLAARALLQK